MTFSSVFAQATVTDLDPATSWYSALFGRPQDTDPMPGLREWHLGAGCGVQVWAEPDRAGRSSIVLGDDDLDATARRLSTAGIAHDGVVEVTSSRALVLTDPDGNRVVLTGP